MSEERGSNGVGLGNSVKFLCSHGGRILPRPSPNVGGSWQLRYVGGETRILAITRTISFSDLMNKVGKLFEPNLILKYQLPNEDLDTLISVTCEDDVENMIAEYDKNESREGSSRLRAFLFPAMSCIPTTLMQDYLFGFDPIKQQMPTDGDPWLDYPGLRSYSRDPSSSLVFSSVSSNPRLKQSSSSPNMHPPMWDSKKSREQRDEKPSLPMESNGIDGQYRRTEAVGVMRVASRDRLHHFSAFSSSSDCTTTDNRDWALRRGRNHSTERQKGEDVNPDSMGATKSYKRVGGVVVHCDRVIEHCESRRSSEGSDQENPGWNQRPAQAFRDHPDMGFLKPRHDGNTAEQRQCKCEVCTSGGGAPHYGHYSGKTQEQQHQQHQQQQHPQQQQLHNNETVRSINPPLLPKPLPLHSTMYLPQTHHYSSSPSSPQNTRVARPGTQFPPHLNKHAASDPVLTRAPSPLLNNNDHMVGNNPPLLSTYHSVQNPHIQDGWVLKSVAEQKGPRFVPPPPSHEDALDSPVAYESSNKKLPMNPDKFSSGNSDKNSKPNCEQSINKAYFIEESLKVDSHQYISSLQHNDY